VAVAAPETIEDDEVKRAQVDTGDEGAVKKSVDASEVASGSFSSTAEANSDHPRQSRREDDGVCAAESWLSCGVEAS
jgi:hypothetical protein